MGLIEDIGLDAAYNALPPKLWWYIIMVCLLAGLVLFYLLSQGAFAGLFGSRKMDFGAGETWLKRIK